MKRDMMLKKENGFRFVYVLEKYIFIYYISCMWFIWYLVMTIMLLKHT